MNNFPQRQGMFSHTVGNSRYKSRQAWPLYHYCLQAKRRAAWGGSSKPHTYRVVVGTMCVPVAHPWNHATQALKILSSNGADFEMGVGGNESESETKFNGLVSVTEMVLGSNSLRRIPSFKNMRSLVAVALESNKITMIAPGDFRGAVQLVHINLGNNRIVSAAAEGFANLARLQVKPAVFNPTDADNNPVKPLFGMGLWFNLERGAFGGSRDFAAPIVSFSPNPVECLWTGPLVSDFNCSTCVLGYETASASNNTCVKPEFRPHKEWATSSDRIQLQFQDAQGTAIELDTDSSTRVDYSVLLTDRTYTIPAPLLEPKERKFVGYQQPYSRIRYELDFSLGAEVDIGCGTAVVGNGEGDPNIPRDLFAHPLSMHQWSYQWPSGRGNLNADPPDPGHTRRDAHATIVSKF